ncbi:hypothetical protein KDA_26950 [Dictyobacter alpinus]|uniref:Uncharacterized protein n=1 Tax=Dictyobacter alpinus TaxID=2014873 RepID=A0A402B762_9CHLR|nr:hypothetical protein KDA_26950 [Dictyobacter alpinus]
MEKLIFTILKEGRMPVVERGSIRLQQVNNANDGISGANDKKH